MDVTGEVKEVHGLSLIRICGWKLHCRILHRNRMEPSLSNWRWEALWQVLHTSILVVVAKILTGISHSLKITLGCAESLLSNWRGESFVASIAHQYIGCGH